MIVTKREVTITLCVRVDAHPRSVLKVLAMIGYKRADVLERIVRMITLVHLHHSVVDNHLVSLANIVTDLFADAVNLVNLQIGLDEVLVEIQIALDVVVVEIQIALDVVVAVDAALLRRSSNDIKTNEDDLIASVAVAFAARVLVQSVHAPIALVNRRQRIPNGVRST